MKLQNSWHYIDAVAEFAIILMYTPSLEFKMNIQKMKVHIYLRLDNSNPLSPPAFQTIPTPKIYNTIRICMAQYFKKENRHVKGIHS